MASAISQIPPSLKCIAPYIRIASQHEAKNPVIAYWCRFYAVSAGLKINESGQERIYLATLMDSLERMKTDNKDDEAFTNNLVAQSHVENHAIKLFSWADQQDRNAVFDRTVIQAFHAAGYLFDVLANFGEVSEENAKMGRYAKWKATYIHKCLKEGKQPIPGPLKGDDEGYEEDAAGASVTPPQASGSGESSPAPTPMPRTNTNFVVDLPAPPKDESTGAYPKVPTYPSVPTIPQATPSPPVQPAPMPIPQQVQGTPTSDQVLKAQKYCKYANSALTYEDVPTAVLNLQKALTLLTTGVDTS